MFNSPRDAYRQRRIELIRRTLTAQTLLSVSAALGLWRFGKVVEPILGQGAILLTLPIIPSLSGVALYLLRRFEKTGWKKCATEWDFSGVWEYRSMMHVLYWEPTVSLPVRAAVEEKLSQEERGSIRVEQTALSFRIHVGTGTIGNEPDPIPSAYLVSCLRPSWWLY